MAYFEPRGVRRTSIIEWHQTDIGVKVETMDAKQESKIEPSGDAVAIYHLVYSHEGFEQSAQNLFKLVHDAQRRFPGKKRQLYLDIEGHRNSKGGFDSDMVELQQEFLLEFLGRFLSKIHCPLASATNPNGQDDEIPPTLILRDARPEAN